MKTIVIDTNVYLTDIKALYSFGEHNIAIPTIVLDEIDKHKHRQDNAGLNARTMNRILDSLRAKGSLFVGVEISEGLGKVFAAQYDPRYMPVGMNSDDSDNKIICTALRLKMEGREVVVVSRDVNMRVKCDSFGITAYDYQPAQVVESVDRLYSGKSTLKVEPDLIDHFYETGELMLPDEIRFYPNQFITLQSSGNKKKSAIARYINHNKPLRKINTFKSVWGLTARNTEQKFAMDLLFDRSIDIVSLTGKAGTGKTLIAAACGLEQVINNTPSNGGYDRLIVTRPVQPMGRDIGFLPGSLEEKMMPWIAPLKDNLEYLFGNRMALEEQIDQGTIEIEAMTYIRGRSIANAFIIVDEAQNLTAHELKTIITRVGHGTKLILTGDVEQIDNSYVDAVSNGLTHAVEKFKEFDISGHITLKKGERSRLAGVAAEIL
jgi:PhoH-like ATPase